ncbi:MAG: RsmD family RNA methyltransferase [Treponema sp.]|nr:RsmD family RNA methyltransferase [Treponema sp.]
MDLTTIIAEKMVFGGNSIGKLNGKTVFIPYAVPGEKLEVRIATESSRKDYDIAEIVNILEKSDKRVVPECRYYGICGGCNMMHIAEDEQKKLRKAMLLELFANNGINLSEDEVNIVSGKSTGYRARFQLNNGGLSEKKGNKIVDIKKCLCAENPVNEYLSKNEIENRPKGRVQLFGSDRLVQDGEKIIIAKNDERKTAPAIVGKKNKKLKLKQNHYFSGTVASPENTACVELDGEKIWFDVRGFFQSNLEVFEKTGKLIREQLGKGKNVLDMYAGCGSISVFLSKSFENITLVEHNRDALVFAEKNLSGKGHVSFGLSGETWAKTCSTGVSFDAAVIDPPRSGMERAVLDYLKTSNIPVLACLSCDPATQARDVSFLTKNGYEITGTWLLDFYPNTSHIESLVILRK